jgi:hypothetical protein
MEAILIAGGGMIVFATIILIIDRFGGEFFRNIFGNGGMQPA